MFAGSSADDGWRRSFKSGFGGSGSTRVRR